MMNDVSRESREEFEREGRRSQRHYEAEQAEQARKGAAFDREDPPPNRPAPARRG